MRAVEEKEERPGFESRLEERVAKEAFNQAIFQVVQQVNLQKSDCYSVEEAPKVISYSGYRNVNQLENFLGAMSFPEAPYPKGLCGTYNMVTGQIRIAEHLNSSLELKEITKVHEYCLHSVMHLPDDYAAIALEQAMCWKKAKDTRVDGGW